MIVYSKSYAKELWQTNKKSWLAYHGNYAKQWCVENKEFLMFSIPLVVGTGVKLAKNHTKKTAIKEDKDHRDLDIYDRSLGIYYRMNRKPTAAEYGQISRRRKEGEDYFTILNSMGLL